MTSVNRRDFLRLSAVALSVSPAANFPAQVFADDTEESLPDGLLIQEATIAQLQAAMAATHSHHSPLLLLASATA